MLIVFGYVMIVSDRQKVLQWQARLMFHQIPRGLMKQISRKHSCQRPEILSHWFICFRLKFETGRGCGMKNVIVSDYHREMCSDTILLILLQY